MTGNILYNDRKFMKLLYEQHDDHFQDNSKVRDAGARTKDNIYHFIDSSCGTVLIVDCENSDPYKLCSALRSLNEAELKKIQKIILYDDIHTSCAWQLIEQFSRITVQHELIERVNDSKSLVDIRLTTGVCKEFYVNGIRSFIILSSDSDFWGLISSLPEAAFLVMVESEKCGSDIKRALEDRAIFYCYLDDFCTGNIDDIKATALINEMEAELNNELDVNIDRLLQDVYARCRIDLTETERKRIFDKYIKTLKLKIDEERYLRIAVDR